MPSYFTCRIGGVKEFDGRHGIFRRKEPPKNAEVNSLDIFNWVAVGPIKNVANKKILSFPLAISTFKLYNMIMESGINRATNGEATMDKIFRQYRNEKNGGSERVIKEGDKLFIQSNCGFGWTNRVKVSRAQLERTLRFTNAPAQVREDILG